MTQYQYNPGNPIITFDDMRLTRLMQQDAQRCASLNEYAAATGIDVGKVLDLIAPALDRRELSVEPAGGEVFIHTAPNGRPVPTGHAQLPPNLWELLRRHGDSDTAFALWRLVRGLEASGWAVEADPAHLPVIGGLATFLGIRFARGGAAPLLVLPSTAELVDVNGPLSRYDREGTRVVVIVLANADLDNYATAIRRWMLERPRRTGMNVVLLEAPRYAPVLLGGDDSSVTPRSVTRVALDELAGQ